MTPEVNYDVHRFQLQLTMAMVHDGPVCFHSTLFREIRIMFYDTNTTELFLYILKVCRIERY